MRILFKSLCCSLVVCCILSMTGFYGACDNISDEVFRLHIIANSDSDEDQSLKLALRDELLSYTAELFCDCKDKDEAMRCAEQQLKKIKSRSESFLRSKGYGYPVEVSVTRTGFNTRVYDDFTLPAGEYDALRVVIGSGQGRNWWCVLYPAMCFSSSGSFDGVISDGEQELVSGGEKYEVKFRIVEIFESLFSFFR